MPTAADRLAPAPPPPPAGKAGRGPAKERRKPPRERRKAPPRGAPCAIAIVSTAAERSFSPPDGVTGRETFQAVLAGPRPRNSRIRWDLVPGAGTGTIEFDSPGELTTVVRARHPNLARVRVRVLRGATVLCEDVADVSVPQFFRVGFTDTFDVDLRRLGLRRRRQGGGRLTDDQVATNALVRAAVVDEIFATLRLVYATVNVRFLTEDPTPAVGAGNFSTVTIGGEDHGRNAFGATPRPTSGRNRGRLDVGNLNAADAARVFSGEYADRGHAQTGRTPTYAAIFDPLRRRGGAVDAGEFADPANAGALTLRQLRVRAAILAFGRLVGETGAHECGHALGLVPPRSHNGGDTGELMDEGGLRTFAERTGITAFDPATGALTIGVPDMLVANLPTLQAILPVPPMLR